MVRIKKVSLLVSSMITVVNFLLLYIYWGGIPRSIPLHIDFNSNIDSYGNKNNLFYLAAFGIVLAVLSFCFSKNAPVSGSFISNKSKYLILSITSMIICSFFLLYSCLTIIKFNQ
ncbi:DUF1648 domain-containing protein [Paenibacillus sp. IHBB 3054]|uniref:DUF1648 domain-containing protein n=1 Tax=Paenibacillus sp. IHBB 3054 TaxID=3425689 RepID=UPI003F67EAC8